MKQIDRDTYELSSGRRFYANCGLISLAKEDDGRYSIGEGYDGHIDIIGWPDWAETSWTSAECQELADLMITRWTEFRENIERSYTSSQAEYRAE